MNVRTVPEENKALVRRFVAAADRSDFKEATRYLSPDITVHTGGGTPGPLDLASFFQFGQAWHSAFPDEETTFEDQIAEGDKVVSRMTSRATHTSEFQGVPPTGKRITVTGIWIDWVVDGRIVERWGQVDLLGVMQQVGTLPTPDQATAEIRRQPLPHDTARRHTGSVEENRALVRRFWEEASRRGLHAVLEEFLTPDVVSHPPRSASPAPVRGLEAWKRFTAAQFGAFPDLAVTVEDLVAEGDTVGARVGARGTHAGELMGIPPTGRQVAFTGMEVFRITDGKIVEQWGEFDALGLLQQLGVMSQPQQAGG
jgi:predicted ester cyclase